MVRYHEKDTKKSAEKTVENAVVRHKDLMPNLPCACKTRQIWGQRFHVNPPKKMPLYFVKF